MMIPYLEINNILFPSQFGFRENQSTFYAASALYDQLIEATENKKYSVVSFLDLSKAFDTVNHEILLAKLSHYGFIGVVNGWFKTYLSDRSQQVCFNNTMSDYHVLLCYMSC